MREFNQKKSLALCPYCPLLLLLLLLLQEEAKLSATDTIEWYDPDADTWQIIDDFRSPAPSCGSAMCVV